MLRPYVDVLKTPGSLAFSLTALVGRLPISMEGLGVVLLVSIVEGSYALAGILASAVAISSALISPLTSRLTDRLGQAKVLSVLAVGQATALASLVVAVKASAHPGILLIIAVCAGALQPNIGSMVRARWAAQLSGTPQLGVAFALESIIDEVIFIIGPVLATALAIGVDPGAALIAAAIVVLIGGLGLAAQRRTQPQPLTSEEAKADRGRLGASVPIVMLIFACLGILFGALEVGAVAFTTERDIAWASGVLLALVSAGSMVGGLLFGTRMEGRNLPRLLVILVGIGAAATIPLPFVSSFVPLAIIGLVLGLITAPSLICGLTIVEDLVPSTRLTESITWAFSGIGLGFAAASTSAGVLIDARGSSGAFIVALVGMVLAFIACLATQPRLLRAWSETDGVAG